MHALLKARDVVRAAFRSDGAQDSFEYVLLVGGVSVAVILAVASPIGGGLIVGVAEGACNAVGLVVPVGSC